MLLLKSNIVTIISKCLNNISNITSKHPTPFKKQYESVLYMGCRFTGLTSRLKIIGKLMAEAKIQPVPREDCRPDNTELLYMKICIKTIACGCDGKDHLIINYLKMIGCGAIYDLCKTVYFSLHCPLQTQVEQKICQHCCLVLNLMLEFRRMWVVMLPSCGALL